MPSDPALSPLPAAALVFPLVIGATLIASGRGVLLAERSGTDHADALLSWLRIACGLMLLGSSGAVFQVCAVAALVLTASSLRSALVDYSRHSARGGAARVAAAAALLAFAAATVASGLLGYDGVGAQLARFDLDDLSWVGAMIGVLAVSGLLQLGRSTGASAATATEGAPTVIESRTIG